MKLVRSLLTLLLLTFTASQVDAQNVSGSPPNSVTSLSSGAITNPTATLTLPTRSNIASSANSVTAASPCVFTWTATPVVNGQTAVLTGTTAPGTGAFTNGNVYYVVAKATNTVELAATFGGAALNCPTTAGVAEVLTLTYEPGELVANNTTGTSVVSSPFTIAGSGGAALIPYLQAETSATSGWGGTQISIHLTRAQATYAAGNGDGLPYAPTIGAGNDLGVYTGVFVQYVDRAIAYLYPAPQVAFMPKLSGTANLYWDVQMLTSGVPISAQTIVVTAGVAN